MDHNIQFDDLIKNHFKNLKKITNSSIVKFFKDNKNIEEYVNSLIDKYVVSKSQVILMIIKDFKLKKCKTCGKLMTFKQSLHFDCCSSKCAARNEDRNAKIEQTNISKYGTKNVFASEIIKEKIKSILIDKYGVDNVQKNKEIHKRTLDTVKEKYKVNNSFNSKNIEKAWKMFESWNKFVIPLFTKEEYTNPQGKIFKWKCSKCGNEFEQALYSTNHLKEINQEIPRCWKCYPRNTSFSNKENELKKFCEEFFNEICFNDTKLLSGTELDIVIPEIKLALEFNGCYWHSIKNNHGNKYHLNKTLKCNSIGYRLIHIWEDEWDLHKDSIKSKLIDIFKGNEKLDFQDDEIILDRSWYNNIEIPRYVLKEELQPEVINRYCNEVENCGYLKYFK